MNFLTRFGDRHDRKEKKMPDRSQSVEPTATPLSPDTPIPTRSRRSDNPRATGPMASPPGTPSTDVGWTVAEDEMDNEAAANHLHGAKRRTVSISRSGRYKSRSKGRSRILSDDVYSGTTPISVAPCSSPTSPTQPPPQPEPPSQPQPPPPTKAQPKKKDLVKPSTRDKSPARPYIILKSDTSVNFAIESTTL